MSTATDAGTLAGASAAEEQAAEEQADVERAVCRVEALLGQARAAETRGQRRRAARLARLLDDREGTAFVLRLTDEVTRIRSPARAARRLADLVQVDGLPSSFGPVDRLMLRAAARVAPSAPALVMPLVLARVRGESSGIVRPAEGAAFGRYAARRRRQGFRLNANVLGEAILGPAEAERRLEAVLERLARPDVDYVSVKVSAICSQLNVLAFDHEVERVAIPLRRLFTQAASSEPPGFVNLDMEEYRDLELTVAVLRHVLDEPAFHRVDAGIVVQAYLPDAHDALLGLCEWAASRRAAGGGRLKVRIVKGANLAMERVDAELHGWPVATYATKHEVDANYKRLLDLALDDRFADAVRVGVATHNLFDVAWALEIRERRGTERVELEMLEGMADPAAVAVRKAAGGLLLYAPLVARRDFEAAVAYLARRLEENASPDNFLRSLLALRTGTEGWRIEEARFVAAVAGRHDVSRSSRRTQDRRLEEAAADRSAHDRFADDSFANEADTDWSLAANRAWIADELSQWERAAPTVVRAMVAETDVEGPLSGVGLDPSSGAVVHRFVEATAAMIDEAVACAHDGGRAWALRPVDERWGVLHQVGVALAHRRGRLVAAMASEAGKTVLEGDPEVSEAVDFARYYAASLLELARLQDEGVAFEPFGVVMVASPWNFPLAIPAGGVLAALAAGAGVVLKPAPESVLTARLLAECCWDAGVPRSALQFLPCADNEVGQALIAHPGVDAVVLTGAHETAQLFRTWRPRRPVLAETSGKNALVITATADLDGAVRDLVRSAFGHAGQKCSAASLAIVEASVYDDPDFVARLRDAVEGLVVGPATDLRSTMGPLIRPPAGALLDALSGLDEGESWLVEPRRLDTTGYRWSPGVKVGVAPGSAFHRTECFGPVLGVMRAASLDDAIELQNAVDFGLTGGIHALDPAEIARWLERVEVGNAYVNKATTGAIVGRQPFGGWKRSSVGPTSKAGGPDYVGGLGRWHRRGDLDLDLAVARCSFDRWWAGHFAVDHEVGGLTVERNVLRYRPLPGVVLRVGDGVEDIEVLVALAAAKQTGTPVTLSSATSRPAGDVSKVIESDAKLAVRLFEVVPHRLRLLGAVDDGVYAAAAEAAVNVDDAPVVAHGRIELRRWVREQSVSETRHRYGNLRD